MSVRVVPYRTGGWEVDVRVVLPDGSRRRERKKLTLSSEVGRPTVGGSSRARIARPRSSEV